MFQTRRNAWRLSQGAAGQEPELPERVDARAFLYDATSDDRLIPIRDLDVGRLSSDQLLWIDVASPRGVAEVSSPLGLTAETVQTMADGRPEPALFAYDGYVHLVIVAQAAGAVMSTPLILDCVVGTNWLLTAHRVPVGFLERFDARIRGDTDLGQLNAAGFLAAILHEHVASYLAELRPIEAEIDALDLRAMTGRIAEEALLRELVTTRIRVGRLRRLLEPHRELYSLLTRSEFAALSGSRSVSDFETLTDLLERVVLSMERTREMVIGSFEIYTTWTAHGTNRVMKRLTVASLTLLPPTLLAGIMGMNSLPHELGSGDAFWATTGAMSALVVAVLTLARLRDWL